MPFRVTLRNQGRAVDGRLVLGGKDVSFEENVSLPENSQKTLTICGFAKDEEALNRVTVAFVSGRKTLAKNTFSNRVLWDSPVVGAVSREGGGYRFLPILSEQIGQQAQFSMGFSTAYPNPAHLPETVMGYSPLDYFVIDAAVLDGLSREQLQAIVDWAYLGGRLLVTGGVASIPEPVASLLPVKLNGLQTVQLDDELVAAGFPRPPSVPESSLVPVSSCTVRPGLTFWTSQGKTVTLAAGRMCGQGRVVFVAFDPQTPILRAWDGNPLWWRVLEVLDPDFASRSDRSNRFVYRGRLRGATGQTVDSVESVFEEGTLKYPSVYVLGMFLLLYIAAVVPANYFFLKKRRSRELALLTVPLIGAAFTVAIYFGALGLRFSGSGLSQVNVIHLLKGWPTESDLPRASRAFTETFAGLMSPGRRRFGLDFQGDGWFVNEARPNQPGGFSSSSFTESFGDVTSVRGIDMNMWETRFFVGRRCADFNGSIDVRWRPSGEGVTAHIENATDHDIYSCVLSTAGYGPTRIGRIQRGEVRDVSLKRIASRRLGSPRGYAPGTIAIPAAATDGESSAGKKDPIFATKLLLSRINAPCLGPGPVNAVQRPPALVGFFDVQDEEMFRVALRGRGAKRRELTGFIVHLEPPSRARGRWSDA